MRLSLQQTQQIASTLRQHFGSQSLVYLFGSHLDGQARGGDIDLYLEPETSDTNLIAKAMIKAKAALYQQLAEQKIDLVIDRKRWGW
ncbi:MAG: DNA polymerase III subunit beta [Oceanospirillum sp.]|nr:DNA polymerase III subunit beta [Oceanospirillum sp.]